MGRKENEFVQPVVKKYRVEVHNKSSEPAKIILGNGGHSMETTIAAKAQWPKTWEIEFNDVPDIKIFSISGKKSYGLRESHAQTNSFIIEDENIICKNSNPLLPRHSSASPDIYGSAQEQHIEIMKNGSRKECSYYVGNDWHNITGTLESENFITWRLVIALQQNKVTHHWCKIDELGSRRNKFSILGLRDADDNEDGDLDYRDHKFEITDNWEVIRDGGRQKVWKFDWE